MASHQVEAARVSDRPDISTQKAAAFAKDQDDVDGDLCGDDDDMDEPAKKEKKQHVERSE
ncbi:hypothetical protein PHYBOEH_001846, partial [Phytophthora boehmeriae]